MRQGCFIEAHTQQDRMRYTKHEKLNCDKRSSIYSLHKYRVSEALNKTRLHYTYPTVRMRRHTLSLSPALIKTCGAHLSYYVVLSPDDPGQPFHANGDTRPAPLSQTLAGRDHEL